MTWDASVLVVGLATIVCFAVALHISGLVARVRAAIVAARQAMVVFTDKTLDEATKERLLQRDARFLLGQAILIVLTAVIVLAMSGVVLWVSDFLGIASFAIVSDFLLSQEVIIGGTVLVAVVAWLTKNVG